MFSSKTFIHLGTAKVTDAVAAEVVAHGYYSAKTGARFDPARIFEEDAEAT